MKIYDAHMHIGGDDVPNPKGLIENLEAGGVYGGGVFSIDPVDPGFTYKERMDNLFAWVKGYEDRLFPFAWLHPYEENVLDKVKDCAERGVTGFKFIPNDYAVGDAKPQKVFSLIEELGLPIFFHSGILYDYDQNMDYNRPANWECFIHFKNLKFSMSHCSHPWYDECLMLGGKFSWMAEHANRAAKGERTIYADFPWIKEHIVEKDGVKIAETPQLYMDTTPGPDGPFQEDLLRKICHLFPNGNQVMFGSDLYVETYWPEVTNRWRAERNKVFDEVGASEEFRRNYFSESFLRFIGK